MSPVRTHFCTLVARGYGGGTSPRKYGLNWTMPALTNRRVGSSRISEALGTLVWPLLSKWLVKRLLISCVCTGLSLEPAGRTKDSTAEGGGTQPSARLAR